MPPRLSSTRGVCSDGEQQHVGDRHERRPLPARRDVARAEVAHHAHAEALREHRRLTQLPGDERRLVPDRLPVKRDEVELGRRHAGPGPGASRWPRRPTRRCARAAGPELGASPPLQRPVELAPFLVVVRPGDEVEQLGAGRAVEPDQRRVHPVERGARHQADDERGALGHARRHRRRVAHDVAEAAGVRRRAGGRPPRDRRRAAPSRWRS